MRSRFFPFKTAQIIPIIHPLSTFAQFFLLM
jgi:hypothetical protein